MTEKNLKDQNEGLGQFFKMIKGKSFDSVYDPKQYIASLNQKLLEEKQAQSLKSKFN